jgi:hypothetical protein
VVIGNGDITGIADDVNHAVVARIETLMALDNPRPRQVAHFPVGMNVHIRKEPFQIGKRYWLVLMDQIPHKKACPGISRSGIRRKEDIVRIHGDVALDPEPPEKHVADPRQML